MTLSQSVSWLDRCAQESVQPINLQIANGATLPSGTVLGRVGGTTENPPLYRQHNTGNTDGSQIAAAVLFDDVTGTQATARMPARAVLAEAILRRAGLNAGANVTDTAAGQLRDAGFVVL